jgi:hypothetical protein
MFLWALAVALPANAQSCPMCYNAAVATKASAIQALRSGTLILIFPVIFLFVGILVMVYRNRNRFNDVGDGPNLDFELAAIDAEDSSEGARSLELDGLPAGEELISRNSEVAGRTLP